MNSRPLRVRVCALLLATLTSAMVLGATVVGMQPDGAAGELLVAVGQIARLLYAS